MLNSQRGYTTLDIVRMVTDANLKFNTIVSNMSDADLARIIADVQSKAVTLKTARRRLKRNKNRGPWSNNRIPHNSVIDESESHGRTNNRKYH